MSTKLRLLTANLKSASLKRLAEGLSTKLGYKVWRSSKQKPNRVHLRYGDCKDKIFQYQWFKENSIESLTYTTAREEALQWIGDKKTVFARLLTRSSEGKGIVVSETPEFLLLAPVYTLYRKKKKEFRVHIFKDKVVAVLEKRRKVDYTGDKSDTKIRNTANGYVFCSSDVVEPDGIRNLALAASKVTTSDFKGVDIGYNEKQNQLFVIEVNSAPGIEGSNVTKYIKAITNV
jgi:glutathione synthase/RimK-type ligase-like ATP-grasp enzyme